MENELKDSLPRFKILLSIKIGIGLDYNCLSGLHVKPSLYDKPLAQMT